MEWKKIETEKSNFEDVRLDGAIYKEHLVLLSRKRKQIYELGKNQLRCWDLNSHSWKIFDIDPPGPYQLVGKLTVYKNSLLAVGSNGYGLSRGSIHLVKYDLNNLGLEVPISPEEQRLKAWFMNEAESDVKFKVQDQIIPAHKEVLIKKSKFFAGLFKSGMAETRQDVIEIPNCDFLIFKEFLRFLYCNEVNLNDENRAFELLEFAERHLQDDLREKCISYLKSIFNSKTALSIFEKAYAMNLQNLMFWCSIHFHITLVNISGIVQCLIPKQNEYPRELRNKVLDWIMENYFEIYHKQNQNLTLCEEFLAHNVEMETIAKIAQFLAPENNPNDVFSRRKGFVADYDHKRRIDFEKEKTLMTQKSINQIEEEAKKIFEQETKNLKVAIFNFLRENWKEMKQKPVAKALPKEFFMQMFSYIFELPNKETEENYEARDKKRKEPIQKGDGTDENPKLEKTKK